MKIIKYALFLTFFLFLSAIVFGNPLESMNKMERLRWAFKNVRFVSYSPSIFNPLPGEFIPASESTILEDLATLRPYFDGLITYSCNSEQGGDKVCPIAAKLQYKAVVLGIWNIKSDEEVATAIRLAKEYPSLVNAVIVGNEGITRGPRSGYDYENLELAINKVREVLPNVAISTSEPIFEYGDEGLLGMVDFHAPNIHPWFSGTERRSDYIAAVDWVKSWVDRLQSASDKPLLVHETGLPSGPEPLANSELQLNFWKKLYAEVPNTESCGVAFWEAYNAGPWKMKTNPSDASQIEVNWGMFTNPLTDGSRNPKPVLEALPDSEKYAKMAYQYLIEVMDRFHETFDVYTDVGAAGNHFIKIAKMASQGGEEYLDIDVTCIDRPHSGATCVKCSFTAQQTNWAGCYFQNGILIDKDTQPRENWGDYPDSGYDLRDAGKLTFWARADDEAWVEFFTFGVGRDVNGNPVSPYPDSSKKISTKYISLSKDWKQYSIDFNNGLDLSYIIGGFGLATSAPYNPEGAVFYLDDIKYTLSDEYNLRRQKEPRFLVSYDTIASDLPFDNVMRNVSFTYDDAVALLAFVALKDKERAKLIADALVYTQKNDRFFSDGRLRNAYQGGDLTCPPGWQPNGKEGTVRVPGFWDQQAKEWYEDIMQAGSHGGNLLWAMIALLAYHDVFIACQGGQNDLKYLESAKEMGEWIYINCFDTEGLGGYLGGFDGWEPGDKQKKAQWKSIEHNLDVCAAFSRLHKLTGDEKWRQRAEHARQFIDAMWDDAEGRFYTGSDDGITPNKQGVLDVNTWALLALGVTDKTRRAIEWAEENCKVKKDGYEGFDFNDDRDGIWWEGTAQMVVVYKILGENEKALKYLNEMRRTQFFDGNKKGIPAASHDGVTTGLKWLYYKRPHVGATAWFIFAELNKNPYF